MINFTRHIIAAPLRVLVWAMGILPLIDRRVVMEAIWFLTGDPDDGLAVVALTSQSKGLEAARKRASDILEKSRSAKVAAIIGFVEMQQVPDGIAASEWIERAAQLECPDMEALLLLKLHCSTFREEYGRAEVIEAILSRNDLPMEYTSAALCAKACMLVDQRRLDDAKVIADQILALEERTEARYVRWLVCLDHGDESAAAKHLNVLKGNVPQTTYNYLLAEGMAIVGRRDEAMGPLYQALRAGLKLPAVDAPLRRLAESEEFAEYCRRQDDRS